MEARTSGVLKRKKTAQNMDSMKKVRLECRKKMTTSGKGRVKQRRKKIVRKVSTLCKIGKEGWGNARKKRQKKPRGVGGGKGRKKNKGPLPKMGGGER